MCRCYVRDIWWLAACAGKAKYVYLSPLLYPYPVLAQRRAAPPSSFFPAFAGPLPYLFTINTPGSGIGRQLNDTYHVIFPLSYRLYVDPPPIRLVAASSCVELIGACRSRRRLTYLLTPEGVCRLTALASLHLTLPKLLPYLTLYPLHKRFFYPQVLLSLSLSTPLFPQV